MNIQASRYEGAEPYIFISYSHDDSELVYPFITEMEKRGYRVWYNANIEIGKQWTAELAEKIAECGLFLPFISRAFSDSEYCMQEVRHAKSEKRYIVPVKLDLDRNQYSKELQFLLENAQGFSASSFPTVEAFAAKLDAEPLFQRCRHYNIEKSTPVLLAKSGLDVFISYHEASAGKLAAQIAAALESNGISCWYAMRDIPPGGDFARYIPPQIDACKVFLLILNENVYQSNHIENEVGLAFGRLNHGDEITILPLEIGNFKRKSWIKYYLIHTQSIKIPRLDEPHMREIIQKIAIALDHKISVTETQKTRSMVMTREIATIISTVIAALATIIAALIGTIFGK